jgi:hypothetical protein
MRKHHEEKNGRRNIQILQTRGESQRTVQIGENPKGKIRQGSGPKGNLPFFIDFNPWSKSSRNFQ